MQTRNELLPSIDRDLLMGGRLCTAPLGLPDRPAPLEPRRAFERYLNVHGVFTRAGAAFDIAPRYRPDLQMLKPAAHGSPLVAALCFGTIHATAATADGNDANGNPRIAFTYQLSPRPWAKPLLSLMHVSERGTAHAVVLQSADPKYNPRLWWSGHDGIKLLRVTYPPGGTNWYPHGLPPKLRWNHAPISV